MGEYRDDKPEELSQHWQAMVDLGAALPSTGLGRLANGLRDGGPWLENPVEAPVILDTDIGGDPDDAIAVAIAARRVPQLALILTTDETGWPQDYGHRARFARWFLDALGRQDVPVTAGASLGKTDYLYVDALVPEKVPQQPDDVIDAVRAVCSAQDGPIRWVGMGPMSNLAVVLEKAPELAPRLRVTQMGGALRYRDPLRAEHNIRVDVPAAHSVLKAVLDGRLHQPEFIASEITFTPSIEITAEHTLYAMLSSSDAPEWAQILTAHLDQWFKHAHPGTMQHDALTLSAALELPFVESERKIISMDNMGRTTTSHIGTPVLWSARAEYEAFMSWITDALDHRAAIDVGLACSEN